MSDDFLNIVANDYDSIKARFKEWTGLNNMMFDEDVFHDTILKCETTLKDKEITEEQAIRYLWKAYQTNAIRETRYVRNRNRERLEDNMNIPDTERRSAEDIINSLKRFISEEDLALFLKYAEKDLPEDSRSRRDLISKARKIQNRLRRCLEI